MSNPPLAKTHARRVGPVSRTRALGRPGSLILIDSRPLKNAAWSEFNRVKKRLDKLTRDLQRHEQTDMPAYESWLHRTFPVLITTLRNLHQEILTKGIQVQRVQYISDVTGRSCRAVWRDRESWESETDSNEANESADADEDSSEPQGSRRRNLFDDFEDLGSGNDRGEHAPNADDDASSSSAAGGVERNGSKDIYRRLVQMLHPDRGGEWTTARARLWHEVQQAWAARDFDWLSRLEVEWESANDLLGPESPLSRIRAAVDELHAARRDSERRLREYRKSVQWQFTTNEKQRPLLKRRIGADLQSDLDLLRRQLDYLNATIRAWEKPRGRQKRRTRASFNGDAWSPFDDE